jgi:hypothetical protein
MRMFGIDFLDLPRADDSTRISPSPIALKTVMAAHRRYADI